MTHLSTEAVAAYVDGELAPVPHERAERHIHECMECAYAVGVQFQCKQSLRSSESDDVSVPQTLMQRLGNIPFSAELDERDRLTGRGIGVDEGGRFEFSVAAPTSDRRPGPPGSLRRSRVFKGGAALVAIGVGLTLSPTILGDEPDFVNSPASDGHQPRTVHVVHEQSK
ncbi:hypothetical protein EK0264_04575 [Epidermidibacterium keratini]|uniref:Putative zinc-finger domain-containing protein n=1 Tax=Epidermidibacterium keratini TaxID=1891644 RepID=A0A7L4YK44_9ACTN|nr:zf-HC2 domain-containing protein [Epidermidibacterium keratini]QHB99630.1 hypothetical protein EK0264_04575 [Epidermidibacterium keratini]